MKKWIESAILGMGVGIPITLGMMALFGGADPVIRQCAVWAAASALYGLLVPLIFRGERPILVELSLYALGGCLITLAGGAICGYLDSAKVVVTMLLIFFAIFVVITSLALLGQKWEEKRTNEKLNQGGKS